MRKDLEEAWEEKGVLIERTRELEGGGKIHYYVPKRYEYFGDTGKRMREGHEEDTNCFVPHVEFDEKSNKWVLHLMGADSGGYDVETFEYYFDDLNDVLTFMNFPLCCSCIK